MYLDHGRIGQSTTRYRYRRTEYDDREEDLARPDTTSHFGQLQLVNQPDADPYIWRGNLQSERVTRDDSDRAAYLEQVTAEVGYRAIGRLYVLGLVGLETFNRADGTRDRFGEEYWEAGGRWTNNRTSIEARYGERFFGESYFAAISHQHRRFTGQLNYREAQQVPQRTRIFTGPQDDAFDEVIDDDLEGQVLISRRLSASGTYETNRSTIRTAAFSDRRESLETDDDRHRYGVDAFWRWAWHERTNVTPRLTWERIDDRDGEVDTLRGARLSISRMLSRNMQAGATVRYQDRTSDDPEREYVENAVTLELTRLF